ncbi:MAG: prolipoprotein diacylglyceryl transferase [Candidatus Moranbacteria bacterium]|nr:prolipoprotein diacylglyceryl transferase [Candidatus Moranbacteria bacterium]
MISAWQHIAQHIDPVAFVIGPFSMRWYALCFIFGFLVSLAYILKRCASSRGPIGRETILDFAPWLFLGILAGGRIGFALIYEQSLLADPSSLFSPFDPLTGAYVGIRGMSFFGALFGAAVTLLVYAFFRRVRIFPLSDLLVQGVPLALMFGRIGNFLNLELPGRVTAVPWAVSYPNPDGVGPWTLRHPSSLYEAGLEGAILFVVMRILSRKRLPEGVSTGIFLAGYAGSRFVLEFLREPDPGVAVFFGWMTMGQSLAVVLLLVSIPMIGVFSFSHRDR